MFDLRFVIWIISLILVIQLFIQPCYFMKKLLLFFLLFSPFQFGFAQNATQGDLPKLAYENLRTGKLIEAEQQYAKLYAADSGNVDLMLQLAEISSRRGNQRQARSYYLSVLNKDSSNFIAHKQLALLAKSRAGIPNMELLKKANQLNPGDADVVVELCQLYFKSNAFATAEKLLEPALKADTANLRLLEMKMPIGVAAKRYKEVIATGNQLLAAGDSATVVLNNLGKSYFMILDYKNALKNFLDIRDTLDKEILFQQIAATYRGLKDYKNAIGALQAAIKASVSTRTATYYGQLGDSYEMSGKNEEANAAYKKGLQFENNGTLYYNIALLYETKLNDKKNAASYYEQYLGTLNEKTQGRQIIFIKRKIEELKK